MTTIAILRCIPHPPAATTVFAYGFANSKAATSPTRLQGRPRFSCELNIRERFVEGVADEEFNLPIDRIELDGEIDAFLSGLATDRNAIAESTS